MNLSLKRVSQTVVEREFWVPFTVISIAMVTADVPSITCLRRAWTFRMQGNDLPSLATEEGGDPSCLCLLFLYPVPGNFIFPASLPKNDKYFSHCLSLPIHTHICLFPLVSDSASVCLSLSHTHIHTHTHITSYLPGCHRRFSEWRRQSLCSRKMYNPVVRVALKKCVHATEKNKTWPHVGSVSSTLTLASCCYWSSQHWKDAVYSSKHI